MSMRFAVLPLAAALLCGCPKKEPAPVSLVADPPPTEDGKPPGAGITALDRGEAYIRGEAWAEALTELDKVLAADDGNARAHYYRGLALKNLERPAEAQAAFEKALALDGTIVEARLHLGELLLVSDSPDPEKAALVLGPAVEAEPKAADTRQLLAYAFFLQEKWSEAADHYAVALEVEDNNDVRFQLADSLFRAGRHDESVPHMRKLLAAYAKEPKVVVQLSRRFGQAKAWQDCVEGFDIAIGLEPNEPALHLHRGVCHHELGDEKSARIDYVKAIEINDDFQPAYFYLGKSWLHEQRAQKAVEAFKKAIKLDPESKIAEQARAELDELKKKSRQR